MLIRMLSGNANVVLRPVTLAELDDVTRIHCAAFPTSALTRLASGAVRRYYEWQRTGPHDARIMGAFVRHEMAGFCVAGVFRGALGGFVRRHRYYLAARVLLKPWFLMHPETRSRVRRGFGILMRTARRAAQPPAAAEHFGILSIAVDPRFRRCGVGRALVADAEQTARERGFDHVILTVDPANTEAIRFYEALNWEPASDSTPWHGAMQKFVGAAE